MSLASERRSNLNPNAPLFVPAAVRQVEDFSPEWWQLVTTSTWYHDYWLSQQQQPGENSFYGNAADGRDIVDLLPDSIDSDEEDILSMEDQYEQFLLSSASKQMPSNGLEREADTLIRSLNLSKSTPRPQVEKAKYPEKPAKPFSPKIGSQRIQQPR